MLLSTLWVANIALATKRTNLMQGTVLLVLFLRQNVLLDTASRHAILLDAQSGQVLAQKRADERTAPASLTKMMTVLLAIETEPDLDK